jgi:hypothetical protein
VSVGRGREDAEGDAGDAAEQCEQDRFGEELAANVSLRGSERAA